MEFIFLLGGIAIGIIIDTIFKKHEKISGVIDVDHNTEQCIVHITSDDLANNKIKKVIFSINHNAKISREEQIL